MQHDLFTDEHRDVDLGSGASILGGFALDVADALVADIRRMAAVSPFRRTESRGGKRMSVAMSNCGTLGWVTDRSGYRYDAIDPQTAVAWPAMPPLFLDLARRAPARSVSTISYLTPAWSIVTEATFRPTNFSLIPFQRSSGITSPAMTK